MTQHGTANGDGPDDQLDRAFEELRGVLTDKPSAPAGTAASAAPASASASAAAAPTGIIMSIPVDVQVVLGRAEMPVADLMGLQKGSTVPLDRRIGEPIDVMVNGRRIARGEIIVMENDPSRFGVRLTEIMTAGRGL
ncbi:flagellar motor switch protein FliN [Arvimicrobium flavum]|uniref:flagellar motor switch protein FliN n=1 Tax=Arvimicrobium flavum TaxID=3393320 RepID=UPI00237B3332|nr:flagellar motor switch protein FliN [Mesorhizobium shangrilense]